MPKLSKEISNTVIRRMPIYHRYLSNLIDEGENRVSSQRLSELTGFTASQIRQDLNNFGGFGQQGYGYNTKELRKEIDKILGINREYKSVLIGAGRLGGAIARYSGFRTSGFNIMALFDVKKIDDVEGLPVLPMEDFKKYVSDHNIEVAIITVPASSAEDVCDLVISSGIKGIWNFSPHDLKTPDGVVVENVRLNDSLLILSYYLKNLLEEEEN